MKAVNKYFTIATSIVESNIYIYIYIKGLSNLQDTRNPDKIIPFLIALAERRVDSLGWKMSKIYFGTK